MLTRLQAAVISGCSQVIGVDRIESRIETAKSFGATHGVNTSSVEDCTAAFKEVTGGLGPTVVIDSALATAPPTLDLMKMVG